MAIRTLLLVVLLTGSAVRAQDTFSIVAVDTTTGEIGSAGASCIPNSYIITYLLPGIGAVHTQSFWNATNQNNTAEWLDLGYTAQMIIDSAVQYDDEANPHVRQYGVVTLKGPSRSAAYTGKGCYDVKCHRTGPTYSIQGNILRDSSIIDSMEARFLRAAGPLENKMMEALQGANSIGADSRCTVSGTSSLSAFIRVARPTNNVDSLYLDINVPSVEQGVEPITVLQKTFDAWRGFAGRTESTKQRSPLFYPNPFSTETRIRLPFADLNGVSCTLIDPLGVKTDLLLMQSGNELTLQRGNLSAGTYRCQILRGSVVLFETNLVVE